MTEIKLVKKYPNIRDEDVTEIFQEGYLKGFENGRKKAIPIEWLCRKYLDINKKSWSAVMCLIVNKIIRAWVKENEQVSSKN